MKKIVFTGGGTGGHVYPGLAVYQYLAPRDRQRVIWIGSRGGVERGIVPAAGIDYRAIPTGKLRRYFDWENFRDLFRVVAGVLAAWRILRREEVDVVFSKGGFVAVPVVTAAWLLRIPVVIHESDSDPGLATRLTAPAATLICVPDADVAHCFSRRRQRRVLVTGNPVREAFFTADAASALSMVGLQDDGAPVVLITGGSLGAQQLNEMVCDSIAHLTRICLVVHQTGDHGRDLIPAIRERASAGRYVAAATFDREFPHLLRRADLVVCRAGAGTIWELAVTGSPAILVPLAMGASRGDQIRNARRYARSGAAIIATDGSNNGSEGVPVTEVPQLIETLLSDTPRLKGMAAAARGFAGGNGARSIAGAITGVIQYNEIEYSE